MPQEHDAWVYTISAAILTTNLKAYELGARSAARAPPGAHFDRYIEHPHARITGKEAARVGGEGDAQGASSSSEDEVVFEGWVKKRGQVSNK